jgi:hypothetical protein
MHKKGLALNDSHTFMVETLGSDVLSYATLKWWVTEFKRSRQSLENNSCLWNHVTVATPEMVKRVHDIVLNDRWATECYIPSTNDISWGKSTFHSEDLAMRKLSACWKINQNFWQKHTRCTLFHANLNLFSSPELKAQVSFSDCPSSLCPSVCLSVCKLLHFQLLLQNHRSILTRLGTNHPWGEGIANSSNEGALLQGEIITKE